jgi:hypothetical protein
LTHVERRAISGPVLERQVTIHPSADRSHTIAGRYYPVRVMVRLDRLRYSFHSDLPVPRCATTAPRIETPAKDDPWKTGLSPRMRPEG